MVILRVVLVIGPAHPATGLGSGAAGAAGRRDNTPSSVSPLR
jgi:hypothetical protein